MESEIITEGLTAEAAAQSDVSSDSGEVIDYSAENKRLKLELECAELGVRKECRSDVIRLAEGSSIAEILEKYPIFAAVRTVPDTGAAVRNESQNEDVSLRRAFGL